jgi:hypothetical protein
MASPAVFFLLRRLKKSGMNSAPMNYGVTCGVLFIAPTEVGFFN